MDIDEIKENAELIIEDLGPLSGLGFGYTSESVAWVDDFIENQRIRKEIDEEAVNGLVNTLGSFLGECIIRCYGGFWQDIMMCPQIVRPHYCTNCID